MISTKNFYNNLINNKIDTFFGVPDSLLKEICAYITKNTSKEKHIITANEGNAIALAAGKYIATGTPAMVYMQNSGLGNAVNPLISLADEAVYKIPMLLMIGWRGEPGKKDEPQHVKQGSITIELLETMGIKYIILSDDYEDKIYEAVKYMNIESKPVALLVKKGMFSSFELEKEKNHLKMSREEALEEIISKLNTDDIIVSTTGKTSREVFEIREKNNQTHECDFLTVGSMGHTSSIAMGISLFTDKNVYCIDGDGSMLMHLGSLGVAAKNVSKNFKYILINNGSHESVGGQPTICFDLDMTSVLKGLGFDKVIQVDTVNQINEKFNQLKKNKLTALIVNTKQGSRDNLGRPTKSPQDNKNALMKFIRRTKE